MKNRRQVLIAIAAGIAIIAAGFLIWYFALGGNARHGIAGKAYGPWLLTCAEQASTGKRCALSLRVVDKSHKHLVLAASVVRGKANAPFFTVVTPPNIMVAGGVQISKDAKSSVKLDFEICTERFCRAAGALNDNLRQLLMSGTEVSVRYANPRGRAVGLKLPTKDFSEGYGAWSAEVPQ